MRPPPCLAAVKYADLSQNRSHNFNSALIGMLALTAHRALPALCRWCVSPLAPREGDMATAGNELHFKRTQTAGPGAGAVSSSDGVVAEVDRRAAMLPNRLCIYLFELSQVFNRFYDRLPVLQARPPAPPAWPSAASPRTPLELRPGPAWESPT